MLTPRYKHDSIPLERHSALTCTFCFTRERIVGEKNMHSSSGCAVRIKALISADESGTMLDHCGGGATTPDESNMPTRSNTKARIRVLGRNHPLCPGRCRVRSRCRPVKPFGFAMLGDGLRWHSHGCQGLLWTGSGLLAVQTERHDASWN